MILTAAAIPLFVRSHPILTFVVIVVVLFVISKISGSAAKKQRSAMLASMGFIEVPREQVFESPKLMTTYLDDAATSIDSPVGKGTSAIGETVIVNVRTYFDDAADWVETVVGFRVSASVTDFEIRHTYWLENGRNRSGGATQRAKIRIGSGGIVPQAIGPVLYPVPMDANPEFAKKFVVQASDPEMMKRVLTSSLMETLLAMNDSKLHIKKWKDWLFVFRWGGVSISRNVDMCSTPPKKYPEYLQMAVDLASRLDLKAASAGA